MEYKASLDKIAKGTTLFVIALFGFIGARVITELWASESDSIFPNALSLVAILTVFLVSWMYAPISYSLTHDTLLINRRTGPVRIALAEIKEARLLDGNTTALGIRTFGVGGFFGYFGKFYFSRLGHVTCYLTQRKNRILIVTTQGKKIMISPDDPGLADLLKPS
jgi:hypothetical protein